MIAVHRLTAAIACGALLSLSPQIAGATEREPERRDLSLSWGLDGTLIGVGLVGTLAPEIAKPWIAPAACRVCHRNSDGAVDVNAFDAAIRSGMNGAFGVSPPTWAKTSDVFMYGVLPIGALASSVFLAHDGRLTADVAVDAGIVLEAVMLSGVLTQSLKFAVGRQRPFVAYDSPWSDKLRRANESAADDNLSFFSGHASYSMATAVGMARVIELRTGKHTGYYSLVPAAVLTALMRCAADKHWGTDVLVGMAVGAAFGLLVPTLHVR